MSHYFSKNQNDIKSETRLINYTYKNHQFTFTSDHGVFSKNHVDAATDLLLNHVEINDGESLLDLGCGYGVIGIVLSKNYNTKTVMVDINERAIQLTKQNALTHKTNASIFNSDGFEHIDQTFDHIVSNPPIRIGKKSLYKLFEDAKTHLKEAGYLWLVMHKKHGALSAIDFLKTLYTVEVVKKHKGFHVIKCQYQLTI